MPVAPPTHLAGWQHIVMMLFVGVLASIPFMYFELDGEDLIAEFSLEAPQPDAPLALPAITMPVATPAPVVTPLPSVTPAPSVAPSAAPAPTAPVLPDPVTTFPAPTLKHHHHAAKAKRVIATHDDPPPATEAPEPPAPEPQPKAESSVPKRPAVQSDDSENPLKRK